MRKKSKEKAAEHYACYVFERNGYKALLLPPRAIGTDVIIRSPLDNYKKALQIQVKSLQTPSDNFPVFRPKQEGKRTKETLTQEMLDTIPDNRFYFFVWILAEEESPEWYIISSAQVRKWLQEQFQKYKITSPSWGIPSTQIRKSNSKPKSLELVEKWFKPS